MLRVKFNGLTGFNDGQLAKVKEAGRLLEAVVNSDEFSLAVRYHTYPVTTCSGRLWWKKCETKLLPGFHYTKDLGWHVWQRICDGAETLAPECDGEIDIDLNLVAGSRGVLGYTYPTTLKTWIAKWFVNSATPAEIAGNMFHEWCHKIGYTHEFRWTPLRQYSVPYALGYIVAEMAGRVK